MHSDRGSQYCSHAYRDLITQHQFVVSVSAKGNCYDNAPIEIFWETLKNELVYHQHYSTYSRNQRYSKLQPDLSQINLYGKINTDQHKLGSVYWNCTLYKGLCLLYSDKVFRV